MRAFDPYDYMASTDMVLTAEEKLIIEKAIDLLAPHITESVPAGWCHYFTRGEEGDDLGIEACDSQECVDAIIAAHPGAVAHRWGNDGDHEDIERCEHCGRPLNEYLTWIDNDFDHLEKHAITTDDIKAQAFDIHAVLQSYPSADERIGGYERHQAQIGNLEPLNNTLARQEAHVARVIAYANLIIEKLKA